MLLKYLLPDDVLENDDEMYRHLREMAKEPPEENEGEISEHALKNEKVEAAIRRLRNTFDIVRDIK